MRKLLIICLIAFLIISPVAASHKIHVNEKRIEGTGVNIDGNHIYIIGELHSQTSYGTLWEEYIVSADDYDRIKYGDTITLKKKGLYYKVVG